MRIKVRIYNGVENNPCMITTLMLKVQESPKNLAKNCGHVYLCTAVSGDINDSHD